MYVVVQLYRCGLASNPHADRLLGHCKTSSGVKIFQKTVLYRLFMQETVLGFFFGSLFALYVIIFSSSERQTEQIVLAVTLLTCDQVNVHFHYTERR